MKYVYNLRPIVEGLFIEDPEYLLQAMHQIGITAFTKDRAVGIIKNAQDCRKAYGDYDPFLWQSPLDRWYTKIPVALAEKEFFGKLTLLHGDAKVMWQSGGYPIRYTVDLNGNVVITMVLMEDDEPPHDLVEFVNEVREVNRK